MAMEIQVTPDVQTAPIYDPELHPSGQNPAFANQSLVDVYLDFGDPNLLNTSVFGTTPNSGLKLPAGTGFQQVFTSRKIYARAAARTTIMCA